MEAYLTGLRPPPPLALTEIGVPVSGKTLFSSDFSSCVGNLPLPLRLGMYEPTMPA
jgi:hypothetical protein